VTARVSAALLFCVVVCFSGPGSQQTPVIVVVKWCCVVIVVIGLYCRFFLAILYNVVFAVIWLLFVLLPVFLQVLSTSVDKVIVFSQLLLHTIAFSYHLISAHHYS